MLAVASLFNPAADEKTRDFWNLLERNCGLSGIKVTPYPHFSWLSAQELDWLPVRQKLVDLAGQTKPFKVYTAGIGIFTGKVPVIYISLIKTELLFNMHQKVWYEIEPNLVQANIYYSPQKWIPHITIGYGDVNSENFPCAMEGLLPLAIDFEIEINNISVLYNTQTEVGIKEQFQLSAAENNR